MTCHRFFRLPKAPFSPASPSIVSGDDDGSPALPSASFCDFSFQDHSGILEAISGMMTKHRFYRSFTLLGGFVTCLLGFFLKVFADPKPSEPPLRAGAFIQDITPPFDSLLINGGFTERRRGKMNPGDLKARCFILERGETTVALAVVDSCMIPRDVCDKAKALVFEATGIPPERIAIAATHTHSAPSTMNYCLGTMADKAYTEFLPGKIAEGLIQAHQKLEPARIGWSQVRATDFTHCRRWITRPDKMLTDPFGEKTVRAMMHPGFRNPNYIGPSGPADDELSLLSIQALDGNPLGVIANFSMHYHGGGGGPSDYFGLFSDRLAQNLAIDGKAPVCAMTQGTSGDLYLRDYRGPKKTSEISSYTDGLVKIAKDAARKIEHQESPPLGMDQKTLTLDRRLPDAKRLAWADKVLASMKGRRPKNRPEVYAEQARYLHENPSEKLVLQTLRIGELGITFTPNEVYAITGLKLKARSPFASTFNIELANGAAGYIPPPEQHALGGYTTWPARTAGLEVDAEAKIVESLLTSLESLAGTPRKEPPPRDDKSARTILADHPLAYWQCEEFDGKILKDASGNNRNGRIEGNIAYHLAGPRSPSFTNNHALQLVGGKVSTKIPGARSLSFWFWNGMAGNVRDNTGDLLQIGDLRLRIGGIGDPTAQDSLIAQQGETRFYGRSKLKLHTWHHVMLTKEAKRLVLYLDGVPEPEIDTSISKGDFSTFFFGGILPFEGRIDEVAWFAKPLTGQDAQRHYQASGITRPPQPIKHKRGATKEYTKAVLASKPTAYWPLQRNEGNLVAHSPPATLEKGVTGNTFNGGRLRAELKNISDTYSVEFWFRNNLPKDTRPVTGYLFSRGIDNDQEAEGDSLGIGGTHTSPGQLIVYQGNRSKGLLPGTTVLEAESWHHVVMTREGDRLRVYLNGARNPEIDGSFQQSYPKSHPQFFFGGRIDNFANLIGNLDHIAVYDRVLTPKEIGAHFKTVSLEKVAKAEAEWKPSSPEDSLKAVHVPKGYQVELAACEPLVKDPVAIDWGPDGRLWVAEMADYPSGIDGNPGGRVRFLEDTDGDGRYEKSTLFLDGLNFPAGIMSWRNGVLIAAAPDIIYAEDTTGDGKADKSEILFTGFKEGNQQLRVNGLHWGLDNWVHGANGSHYAGYAKGTKITSPRSGNVVELGSFDFRMKPDSGLMEPLSGPSQFGRTRDDWGNSFGVQNSFPLWHYVVEHRYLNSNPDYPLPDPRRQLRPQNARVFPASKPQKRFHSFNNSGRFTSACSPMIYRDELLFADDATHAFTCEPFHNLVQHVILKRDGGSFTATRTEPDGEKDFFASEDRWCRPVMARTGPDGALWVVDMYRYMIEHPDWLPKDGKAEMKPHERKGEQFGRIYRVTPKTKSPRKVPQLDQASSEELVQYLGNPSGTIRDLAHRLLVERKDVSVADILVDFVPHHLTPQARLHALGVLDGMERLEEKTLRLALYDAHPGVRRYAIELAAFRLDQSPVLRDKVVAMLKDPDLAVRFQAACSLATSKNEKASQALIRFGSRDSDDPNLRAVVFNSALAQTDRFASSIISHKTLLPDLIRTPRKHSPSIRKLILAHLKNPKPVPFSPRRLKNLAAWLDRYPQDVDQLGSLVKAARELSLEEQIPESTRADVALLLGRQKELVDEDQRILLSFLNPPSSPILRKAALSSLARIGSEQLPADLFQSWPAYPPATRKEIIDTLLQRNDWTLATLKALEQGKVIHHDLDLPRQQQLLKHKDDEIRKTAERVIQKSQKKARKDDLVSFRPALKLKGNGPKGKAIFEQRCAVCHLSPQGQALNGPDLRAITDRSKNGLFTSILDPNQSVDPNYLGYSVGLKNGSSFYGRILSEAPNHLTIRLLNGTDHEIARRDIKSLTNSQLSLMPEGLEAGLTHQDLADLISFLQTFGASDEGR
jgi:putative membrane-bound dehydrogenase-like protein